MKRPLLFAAVGVLVTANAFVLIHAAVNRSGAPDAELELTARELKYYPSGREDSGAVLALNWQNSAAQYPFFGTSPEAPARWFGANKLKEIGFDVSVPPASKDASRYYARMRSRQVFVALELDGPAWKEWLDRRKAAIAAEPVATPVPGTPRTTVEDRIRIDEETSSRLVAIDVGLGGTALRAKYPDRQRVMILRGRAQLFRDDGIVTPTGGAASRVPAVPYLRGVITSIDPSQIYVSQPLSRKFDSQASYMPWTYSGEQVKIAENPYTVTLRVGSQYEPWVVDVKTR